MPELKSGMGIKGVIHIELFGEDGVLKDERTIGNTITVGGDAHVADQMSDSGDAAIGFMAVGTTSGGKSTASTGLEASNDRNALTSTTQGAGAADNDVIYIGDWAAGEATAALIEAGILLTDDNTSLMAYADFAAINKGAADTLKITWTLTFGAS